MVMDVVYGIEVLPKDDPYIDLAEKAMASVSGALVPDAFLVYFIPMCE